MPASQYAEHVVPIFDQLSTGAWFTSRTSIAALWDKQKKNFFSSFFSFIFFVFCFVSDFVCVCCIVTEIVSLISISCLSRYATAYPKLDDKGQKLLRELFAKLATDSTPMVRRAAATALGNFAIVQVLTLKHNHFLVFLLLILKCLFYFDGLFVCFFEKKKKKKSKSHSKNEMLPLFEKLAADDQDSVRVLAVDNCIALAPQLGASTVVCCQQKRFFFGFFSSSENRFFILIFSCQ